MAAQQRALLAYGEPVKPILQLSSESVRVAPADAASVPTPLRYELAPHLPRPPEVSVEANPDTVDAASLAALADGGVDYAGIQEAYSGYV